MTLPPRPVPKPMAVALLLALLSILFGFGLGGAFGFIESRMKQYLDDRGTEALDTAYQGDAAAKEAVVAKSWIYLQRAHLHGGAIGATALGSILLLLLLGRVGIVARVSAIAFGAGALTYSVYWLWAGLLAPGLGGTGAAKEALAFLAIPGTALCIIGLLGTLCCVIGGVFNRAPQTDGRID